MAEGAGTGAKPGEKEAQGGPCGSAQLPDRRGQPGGSGSAPGNRDRRRGNGLRLGQGRLMSTLVYGAWARDRQDTNKVFYCSDPSYIGDSSPDS